MKKTFTTIATLFMLFALFGCKKTIKVDSSTWLFDLDLAKIAAEKENKDILMVIGCGDEKPIDNPALDYPSFRQSVMFSDEFVSKLTEKYVLVDYEYNDELYEKAFESENEEDEKKISEAIKYSNFYAIQTVPAVSILSKEGFIETQIYFDEELPKTVGAFLEYLDAYSDDIALSKSLIAATRQGSTEERIAAMDNFYELARPDVKNTTVEISRALVALDKNNKSGLVPKHLMAIAFADFWAALYEGEIEKALAPIDEISANEYLSPDDRQELYFSAAYILAESGYPDYAKISNYLQKAYDASPNSLHGEYVKSVLDQVKTMVEAESQGGDE